MRRRLGVLLTAGALALTGCTDRMPSTAPVTEPPIEPPGLARMRGTVDLISGTMTFEPIGPAHSASSIASKGISAAVYGDQGVTLRIYNSPVSVSPAAPGKKRNSASVGVRNLLPHTIGDEQAGPAAHNLGIFVFVTAGPTVTGTSSACSPACTVSVVGQDGIFNFTTPGQRYWFWQEQLAAAGQVGDTTTFRRTWTFEADTQVTGFQFDVLVSAAWPPPHESRWAAHFGGDSLPNDGTEPRWIRQGSSASTALNQPAASHIRITVSSGGTLVYYRIDSLNTASDAYIEARLALENAFLLINPEVSFGIDDQTKYIAAGLSGSAVGFMTGTGSLTFAVSTPMTTMSFHTYRLSKFASDSVVLYVDGVRRLQRAYSLFPGPLPGSAHGFYFGPLGTGSGVSALGNQSAWDYVIYEIGATQP